MPRSRQNQGGNPTDPDTLRERFGRDPYVYVWHMEQWHPGTIHLFRPVSGRIEVRSLDNTKGWRLNKQDIALGKIITEEELVATSTDAASVPIGMPYTPDRKRNPRMTKLEEELFELLGRHGHIPVAGHSKRRRAALEKLRRRGLIKQATRRGRKVWVQDLAIEEGRKRNPRKLRVGDYVEFVDEDWAKIYPGAYRVSHVRSNGYRLSDPLQLDSPQLRPTFPFNSVRKVTRKRNPAGRVYARRVYEYPRGHEHAWIAYEEGAPWNEPLAFGPTKKEAIAAGKRALKKGRRSNPAESYQLALWVPDEAGFVPIEGEVQGTREQLIDRAAELEQDPGYASRVLKVVEAVQRAKPGSNAQMKAARAYRDTWKWGAVSEGFGDSIDLEVAQQLTRRSNPSYGGLMPGARVRFKKHGGRKWRTGTVVRDSGLGMTGRVVDVRDDDGHTHILDAYDTIEPLGRTPNPTDWERRAESVADYLEESGLQSMADQLRDELAAGRSRAEIADFMEDLSEDVMDYHYEHVYDPDEPEEEEQFQRIQMVVRDHAYAIRG